jgi:proteasome lid subunit RPN8/RPN11
MTVGELGIHLTYVDNEITTGCAFEFSRSAYDSAMDRVMKEGKEYLGLFHSHPIGEAVLSAGDLKASSDDEISLIYDVCGKHARLWHVTRRDGLLRIAELKLEIERGKPRTGE